MPVLNDFHRTYRNEVLASHLSDSLTETSELNDRWIKNIIMRNT